MHLILSRLYTSTLMRRAGYGDGAVARLSDLPRLPDTDVEFKDGHIGALMPG